MLDTHKCYCPYCGETIELLIDLSEPQQEYVEDCSVCCRPIIITVNSDGDQCYVDVRSEND